ncbi:hypothetical protein LB545_07710 [Mesorhizobium sp. BR1-1-6]|uniref:hypothetical protein n=1 Tax=Mesorhizobium sp. BR1-1-6 TaxID=2876648 RepID=UPI001CD14430|nr:hypothetical protein [Mesorhizobium sp. BR1-1-6]MBZ9894229.1 hypothetical protein [Mesorhizobium sp. BR1-1-6]
MNMLERVACQVALVLYGGYPLSREEREKGLKWAKCLEIARAAIEAMRFADGAMQIAMVKQAISADHDDSMELPTALSIYLAGIDAALTPKEG